MNELLQPSHLRERHRLHVRGVVQGVGFRPFVYGLAQRLQLVGFIANTSSGVTIEIEGETAALSAFQAALRDQPPPLAHIEAIVLEKLALQGDLDFRIVTSAAQPQASTLISPDICLCEDCRRELFDPYNRRYRYPFINCTNCGPRFTITKALPYDRPFTTMAAFPLCPACQAEYEDPMNRRFHAQPNACPQCGPALWLDDAGQRYERETALQQALVLLKAGKIIAVKGIGGFHLACDATNPAAVARLRERKARADKPFAVMARDVAQVQQLVIADATELALLTSRTRPILLLPKQPTAPIAALVAPNIHELGVFLPYTPLHELLLEQSPPLVMTSGNFSGEPIITTNEAALERLSLLADALLLHDREIHVPCDDSVLRLWRGIEFPLRRSRGYAPFPLKLPLVLPSLLAVGGELKNTFCLVRADHAFMSQHIGDVESPATLHALTQSAAQFETIFATAPQAIIADAHPRYHSAQWAKTIAQARGLPLIEVQHHHAHIAAVMAEHSLSGAEPVIGVCLDGTGYGTDGAVWGGEVLVADYHHFERKVHLGYVPLVGGDSAVKHPCRLALAYLWAAGIAWTSDLAPVAATTPAEQRVILRQLETNFNTVPTSSMGRLFDAVSALIGVCQQTTYEAQAALELEARVDQTVTDAYRLPLTSPPDHYHAPTAAKIKIWHIPPLLQAIVADLRAHVPVEIIAAKFHHALAQAILAAAQHIQNETGIRQVALSGGVFQNVILLERVVTLLEAQQFTVYTHRLVPANDGGIALGQAMIGGMHLQTQR